MPQHRSTRAGLIVAGSLALGIASSQPRSPPGNPVPCNRGVCTLTLTIDGDCTQPGNIRIDKPFVSVDAALNMRWTIAAPGFEFEANGIDFDPPNAQFQVQNSPRPNEFRIHNSKSANGDFYYFVNIKGCARFDPWVRNH